MIVHHVARADDWEQARATGVYPWSSPGRSVDDVGFAHCAHPSQLDDVLARFDVDEALVVLDVDTDRLSVPWRDEPSASGERWPHVLGRIDVDAVVGIRPVRPSAAT